MITEGSGKLSTMDLVHCGFFGGIVQVSFGSSKTLFYIINKFSFEIPYFVQDDKHRFGNDFGET
jgi:hypothetical protein